jgi:hypothetical protein
MASSDDQLAAFTKTRGGKSLGLLHTVMHTPSLQQRRNKPSTQGSFSRNNSQSAQHGNEAAHDRLVGGSATHIADLARSDGNLARETHRYAVNAYTPGRVTNRDFSNIITNLNSTRGAPVPVMYDSELGSDQAEGSMMSSWAGQTDTHKLTADACTDSDFRRIDDATIDGVYSTAHITHKSLSEKAATAGYVYTELPSNVHVESPLIFDHCPLRLRSKSARKKRVPVTVKPMPAEEVRRSIDQSKSRNTWVKLRPDPPSTPEATCKTDWLEGMEYGVPVQVDNPNRDLEREVCATMYANVCIHVYRSYILKRAQTQRHTQIHAYKR